MNWKKWPKLLEHQMDIFLCEYKGVKQLLKFNDSHLDWGSPLCEMEDECRDEVEAAIHQYAESRTWPKLSPVAGAMLQERLGFARSLMDQLQWYAKQLKMGPPTKDMDEEETICWFLIDAWEKFGFENLMNDMRAVPTRETAAMQELRQKLNKDFFQPGDN